MSNLVKDINIKKQTHYFFDDSINIKDFDPNETKTHKKLYKNILIYYIAYVTIKDSKYVKINSVTPLYLMFNKMNGYFEEINENKYLTLVPTSENKEKIKKYEEQQIKIRYLIRSVTKKSDDYDEKYVKIKLDSDDKLPLNKTIESPFVEIVVTWPTKWPKLRDPFFKRTPQSKRTESCIMCYLDLCIQLFFFSKDHVKSRSEQNLKKNQY